MKKFFTFSTVLTILMLLMGTGTRGQILKQFSPPNGTIQQSIIEENHLAVLNYYGTFYDNADSVYKSDYRVLEYNNNTWTTKCFLQVFQGDFIQKFFKLGNNYYFYGLFTKTAGTPHTKTVLIVYENFSFKKIYFHQLFPHATYCEPSGGLYNNGIQNSFAAISNDSIYMPLTVFRDTVESYTACVRYVNGVVDTMHVARNATKDVWKGPDGKAYIDFELNWYQVQGLKVKALDIPLEFTYKKNGDVIGSKFMLPWLFPGPREGTYAATNGEQIGNTGLYEENRWLMMKGPSQYVFFEIIYCNEVPYARAGTLTNKVYLMKYDNNTWDTVMQIPKARRIGVYGADLLVYGLNGTNQLHILKTNVSKVSGIAFLDMNYNCTKDPGEKILRELAIIVQPHNYIVYTDYNGEYALYLDSGQHSISISKPHHKIYCSAPGQITAGFNKNVTVHVPVTPTVDAKDLKINVSSYKGFQARRGDSIQFEISVSNKGSMMVQSAYVVLKYDTRWTGFSSSQPYTEINTGTVRFKLNHVEDQKIKIPFKLHANQANLKMNDISFFYVEVRDSTDMDTIREGNIKNNVDSIKPRIVSAYDPNEKKCYPALTNQMVREIRYHIDFQNLGTDSAVNIIVQDTLDKRIITESIVFTGASHHYRVTIKDRLITWTFPKIMLPPASANYKGSMGFASFIAELDTSLAANDSLRNRAFIYFDYEDAVITNYAVTRYDPAWINSIPDFAKNKLAGTLPVYPNPAHDEFYISINTEGIHTLTLSDASGRTIAVYSKTGSGELRVEASMLSSGIYILRDELGRTARISIL